MSLLTICLNMKGNIIQNSYEIVVKFSCIYKSSGGTVLSVLISGFVPPISVIIEPLFYSHLSSSRSVIFKWRFIKI